MRNEVRLMRKRSKNKRHSCAMCKPHKMGGANRWKPKDEMLLKEFEKVDPEEVLYNQNWYDAIDAFDYCEEKCCKG